MGGHSVTRDNPAYREMAQLAAHLSDNGYLIVTGGGPGIMEAAHFGVSFSGPNGRRFDEALALLCKTPSFPDLGGLLNDDGSIAPNMEDKLRQARDWLAVSLEARHMIAGGLPISLAIPTSELRLVG
jgi:hypothetical protein